jgi:glycosyltransferase involved in cell wall biosynthesis
MRILSNPSAASSTAREEPVSARGLRVALFSGNYNYIREGANQALNKLVQHLLAEGAEVRVYSPTTSTPAFEPAGDLVSVPSFALPLRSEFRVGLGLPSSIRSDIRRFNPNLIHLSTPDWLGTSAQRFARKLGVPVVASMHTRFESYLEYYGLGALRSWAWRHQRRFYRNCDRVLVPNHASLRHVEAMDVPVAKLRIWSRGVDGRVFSPARRDVNWRRAQGFADDDLVLLFFGRIVREKGTAVFADTVDLLRARGLRIRPLVVGDGPARSDFAARLGDAIFTGHLDDGDLGRAVASADILLNPSLTETLGNVNLEAMAAGLCLVCADAANTAELIESGVSGFLCPDAPEAFADMIAMLAKDSGRRIAAGRNAASAASKYQWPEILDSVVRVYSELVETG